VDSGIEWSRFLGPVRASYSLHVSLLIPFSIAPNVQPVYLTLQVLPLVGRKETSRAVDRTEAREAQRGLKLKLKTVLIETVLKLKNRWRWLRARIVTDNVRTYPGRALNPDEFRG
jgi:hypothetical protein